MFLGSLVGAALCAAYAWFAMAPLSRAAAQEQQGMLLMLLEFVPA